jgi:autotransporter-associated beta strand protein
MNKKTILKFNSTSSIRPFAWLALAILAVGAFENSVQAQWLNETFEQYTVTSPESQPTVGDSPFLQLSSVATTVINSAVGKQLRYSKLTGAATGNQLQYSFSLNNGTDRRRGYYSFKITQNSVPSPLVGSSDFFIRLGSNDSTSMNNQSTAYLDVRFRAGTPCTFSVRSGGTTQSVITSVSATAQHTVQVWYNSEATTMSYTDPNGNSQTLGANSYVCYVNRLLANPTATGSTMVSFVTPTGATAAVSHIGKIAFGTAGANTVDFLVDDIYAADSAPVASGPTIDSPATAPAQAGYPFTYTITSSGVATPVYTASPLPSGLGISGGVISGTLPTTATVGTTNITLTATGTGGPATKTLALTITAPPTAVPSIGSTATTSGKVTVPFSYQIMASGSGGPITSYTATPLPAGLSLNPTTGVISGTPSATGTTSVICTATNPIGTSSTQTLTITIDVAPTATWNGTGALWNSATSWNPQAVPSSLDTAIFADLGSTRSVNVGTVQTIAGILFNSVANAAYSLTGTDIIVGSVGGITNSAAAIQTFENKVINAGGTATWSSVLGGSLVFNGGIDLSSTSTARALIFGGVGNVTVSGVIANGAATSGTVTVNGTGTTTFSGNNTYDGLTTMNAPGGTLTLSGNNSGATGGVTLTAGTLNINNANALGFGVLNLAGTGATINNTSGTAVVNAGDQPWTWNDLLTFGASGNTAANNLNLGTGVVTASSSRTITLAGTGTKLTVGRVNITSSSSGRTLTANGAGNTLEMGGLTLSASVTPVTVKLAGSANIGVNGPIVNGTAFAHGVEVLATGTTTFSGVNTYTGLTTISAGTLILSEANSSSGYKIMGFADLVSPILKINAVNALSASANLTGGNPSSRTGTLEFGASGNYTLNQFSGDNIRFSNSSGSATTLTFTSAANLLSTGGGRIFANQSANLTITFNGQVDIGGLSDDTCTISAIGPVVISGPVVNSSSFVRNLEKSEVGNLTMSGVNSYNGTTTVSRGTLSIPMGGSLAGCGATIVRGGTSSANPANLNLAGAAGVVQVGQNGFVRGYTSGSTTTLGTIISLEVQNAGTVEIALDRPWTTDGTINFATGSKVSVTGTPVTGERYPLMTATEAITGNPTLAPTASTVGWGLRVIGSSLYLQEVGVITIGDGVSETYSIENFITGTDSMTKRGTGTLILSAPNDYTGGTFLEAGTLEIGNSFALGSITTAGAVTLTGGTLKSTVDLNLGRFVAGAPTSVGRTEYQEVYGANSRVQYSGLPTTINGPVTLDVGDGTTMTMGTLIGNSSPSNLVTKIGAGTVKLIGGSTRLNDAGMALNGNASSVLGGWRIEAGTVWFGPSANNGGGNGPITLAGGTAKFSKLQNSNGTYTEFLVPSDLTVESSGLIQFDPDPVTLLGQNKLGFNNLSIGANTLNVATATTSTVVGQGLPSVNFQSATLTGSATLNNPENLDLDLQAVSGTGGFTKMGSGTLYLSEQPNQAAAFAGSLVSGGLVSINVEYAGSGYAVPPAAAPAVRVVPVNGGPGSGALATATIGSNGRVSFITVTAPGSGYTSLPRIEIDAPLTVATANSYTGASTVQEGKLNLSGSYATSVTVKSGAALELDWLAPAQAECSVDAISPTSATPNASFAYVKNLYLTKSVGGYVPSTTFEFDLPAPVRVDGTGTATETAPYVLAAARASATVDSNGFISALSIVSGGSGYALPPIVTIPAPTVPTVIARTSGRVTFDPGATLALNIASPTSASYTLLTADDGIIGTPSLETAIPGYALIKSSDGKSLILTDMRTDPNITSKPLSATITYGQTLSSLAQSLGSADVAGEFAWKNAGTLLPAGTSSQIVIFTPNDLTAYRPAEFTVSVTVSKANPTVTWPTTGAITYGEALSAAVFSGASTNGNFAFTSPETIPNAGIAQNFEVIFTPEDTANYNTLFQDVAVTVNKANPTVTWPTAGAITAGQALSLSTLSGGSATGVGEAIVEGAFAWTDSTTARSTTGSYEVTFTPTSGNYNTATQAVSVTVNPAGTIYNDWLTANGGSASDAAFLDYVFGAATPGALPASLKPTVAVTSGNLVLTYYVRTGTLGLTVTAQTSADLATGAAGWGTSGVTDVPVGEPTTAVNGVRVQQRTASVSVSGGRKFLRIQAVQAAP